MFGRILALALLVAVAWAVAGRASSAAEGERSYRVKPGDTLWAIAAQRYGGDPRRAAWKIERRNGLAGGAIRAGQRLVLP